MKQTERYGLNQWDLSDRIRMEDFNADNQITDTILAALDDELQEKLGGPELIASFPSDGHIVHGAALPLPKIDWNEWRYVILVVHYPGTKPEDYHLNITLTDETESVAMKNLSTPCYALLLLPRHDGSSQVTGFLLGNYLIPFRCPFAYEELTRPKVELVEMENIPVPSAIYLGVR